MAEVRSSVVENFSITAGGPLHRLLTLAWITSGMNVSKSSAEPWIAALSSHGFPLLLLSIIQGSAWGHQIKIPFLRDLAVNVRLLIAVPILILAESRIDRRWHTLVLEFLRSELVRENTLPSFEAILEKNDALARSRLCLEVLLLVAAFFTSIFINKELLMSGTSNWHSLASGQVSAAGWWFSIVCTPIFRFLLLRWFWRMFLWTSFLWSISRINLFLVATHTDLAAGLGFLSEGQKAFKPYRLRWRSRHRG